MSRLGHSAKSTPAQRAEVLRLRSEGRTIRAIAEEVFGHERLRGRVERIVAPKRAAGSGSEYKMPPGVELEDVDFDALTHLELLRLLMDRTLRYWAKTGETPSMNELSKQLDVMQRLYSMESYERTHELTIEPQGPQKSAPAEGNDAFPELKGRKARGRMTDRMP
jgi:hypothetical protein